LLIHIDFSVCDYYDQFNALFLNGEILLPLQSRDRKDHYDYYLINYQKKIKVAQRQTWRVCNKPSLFTRLLLSMVLKKANKK
jgi:hypothetical protein